MNHKFSDETLGYPNEGLINDKTQPTDYNTNDISNWKNDNANFVQRKKSHEKHTKINLRIHPRQWSWRCKYWGLVRLEAKMKMVPIDPHNRCGNETASNFVIWQIKSVPVYRQAQLKDRKLVTRRKMQTSTLFQKL